MPNRKEFGRTTLRLPPELHQELVWIAETMGLDLTGLINLMIRESLRSYQEKAVALQTDLNHVRLTAQLRREQEGQDGG